MIESTDPSDHRQREDQFIEHVNRLLEDDRLRLDTTSGRRPVTQLIREISQTDHTVDLTRLMSQLDLPDRDLRDRMPRGQTVTVKLARQRFWIFKKPMGQLKVICTSPNKAILTDEKPTPLTTTQLADLLRQADAPRNLPVTIVVMSTAGFDLAANSLAERSSNRTVILASPNSTGGWTIVGPAETKALTDLFDPEADAEKRRRLRHAIDESRVDLAGSGLASDRLAAKTSLAPPFVESELKQYARENAGLVAKRLDGKMVLFRSAAAPTGGIEMPFIDRMKALFARKGETEKKIAFLAERRAALSQQRDRGYEEIGELEKRESDLRQQFAAAVGNLPKRRITSQLLQLQKDMERRQQLMAVLNQQVNVVATHLHNLELVQQGHTAHLPDSEEMASDAAAAEEMIAELQANTELADSVGATAAGMSAEEQALFEELERQSNPDAAKSPTTPATAQTSEPTKSPPTRAPQSPERRATPEAG